MMLMKLDSKARFIYLLAWAKIIADITVIIGMFIALILAIKLFMF